MPVGSTYEIYLPPDLAYGDQGAPPAIGPGSLIIFQVELLDIVQPQPEGKAEADKADTKAAAGKAVQSIFMLSYVYPLAEAGGNEFSDYWKAIHAAGSSKIPYTLIMADGGPDAKLDPGYVRLLKKNAELGFKTVAYIRTIHQTRPIAEVKAAMAKFIELYGADKIHGFYFDEISSRNNGATAYMAELYNYTKSTYGNKSHSLPNYRNKNR